MCFRTFIVAGTDFLLAFRVKIACLYSCSYVVRHNLYGVGGGGIRQKDCRGGTKENSGA